MGLGRIGKQMKGRCKEHGCTTTWNSAEEYLKCQGCSWHGCKIAEKFQERQTNNAAIEADRIIERMRNRHQHKQNKNYNKEPDNTVYTEEVPIESFYLPAEGEIEMERTVAPVLAFTMN